MEEFRTDTSLVKEQELKLAEMLVESLAAPFEPQKYHDTYRDNLQALIDAKIKGQEVVTPPHAEPAKVIDIMEALKQSLAAAKKPPASVETLERRTGEEGRRQEAIGARLASITCPPGAAGPCCSPGRCIPSVPGRAPSATSSPRSMAWCSNRDRRWWLPGAAYSNRAA